jgi:hypothetical protein
MKNILIIIFPLLFLNSCSTGQSTSLPDVPKAFYPGFPPEIKGDTLLFSMSIKNDIVQIPTSDKNLIIESVDQIEEYYCQISKIKMAKYQWFLFEDYYIALYIDSTVSYIKVDQLFEELKLIQQKEVFLKTSCFQSKNTGMYISLLINTQKRQKIAVDLYGSSFLQTKNLRGECAMEQEKNNPIKREGPPQADEVIGFDFPIDETVSSDIIDEYLALRKSEKDTNYFTIEKDGSKLFINQKQGDIKNLLEIIKNKNSIIFLKPSRNNTFNDFIKLIDVLYYAQYLAFQEVSHSTYQKDINELTNEQYGKVVRLFPLCFYVLTFTDQKYIENN